MSTIQVTILDMKGNKKLLSIKDSATIAQGKSEIGHELGRVWKYDATNLDNNKTFKDYEIENGETIVATNKVIGG